MASQTCQCEKMPDEIANPAVNPRSAVRRHTPTTPTRKAAGVNKPATANANRRFVRRFFRTLGPLLNRILTTMMRYTNLSTFALD